MITRRISILIAVLILSFSGLSVHADTTVTNTSQTGAAGTGKEHSQKRVYTAEELSCMAQYYYKRTSRKEYYPPEAACKKLKDGSYQIVLRELVSKPTSPSNRAFPKKSVSLSVLARTAVYTREPTSCKKQPRILLSNIQNKQN